MPRPKWLGPGPGSSRRPINLGRHKRYCKICSHEGREEIEQDFVTWKSPIAIAEEYGLADRMNVYRHATALGLFEKRRRNIRAALARIIERAGDVKVAGRRTRRVTRRVTHALQSPIAGILSLADVR